jgi:hypothetical protein
MKLKAGDGAQWYSTCLASLIAITAKKKKKEKVEHLYVLFYQ